MQIFIIHNLLLLKKLLKIHNSSTIIHINISKTKISIQSHNCTTTTFQNNHFIANFETAFAIFYKDLMIMLNMFDTGYFVVADGLIFINESFNMETVTPKTIEKIFQQKYMEINPSAYIVQLDRPFICEQSSNYISIPFCNHNEAINYQVAGDSIAEFILRKEMLNYFPRGNSKFSIGKNLTVSQTNDVLNEQIRIPIEILKSNRYSFTCDTSWARCMQSVYKMLDFIFIQAFENETVVKATIVNEKNVFLQFVVRHVNQDLLF
ncbi:hypothetical protein ECANGB1_1561 [Enterospora canceri]|uniref:Uncharacterized protein n=1 Tax=Enterospora canceri TaxID=1081671 RepID=A0A1Y1S6J4_9MICR|nr:hypothetical protein ECANGB1_1561 [Enterospora canceri]